MLPSLVNDPETLVKPAESEATLRAAIGALAALGIRLVATFDVRVRHALERAWAFDLAAGL